MTSSGFLTERTNSPAKFGMVLALHAAAIGGVLLIKNPGFIRNPPTITDGYNVPEETPLPPINPPPPVDRRTPIDRPVPLPPIDSSTSVTDAPTNTVPLPPLNPVRDPVVIADAGTGAGNIVTPPLPPVHVPVRMEAVMSSGAVQPTYPAVEIRNNREGSVQVRVTISAAGRVTAVERLSATSDAFFEATRRQAMERWRFRPATEDGRPTTSTKVLTIHFRLDGIG